MALSIVLPTFKAGDLIQLLGIGGVAIGFAFRDILQNFLAGILLLVTEPFRIDDQIVFGEFEGTVEDIHTRATLIRTYDGRQIVIPNAKLFTESVTVNTALDTRRLEYDVGIGVSDDIDRAKALILEAVRSVQGVLPEPAPDILVVKLADFSIQLRVRWWIQPPRRANALDMRDQVLAAIKNTLLANGIDLPFPTQQILFHDQTEETDGDRTRQREGWPAGKDNVPEPRSIAGAFERAMRRASRPEPRVPLAADKVGMKTTLLDLWYALRPSFWLVPALMVMMAIVLALGMVILDERVNGWVKGLGWMPAGQTAPAPSLKPLPAR